MPRRAPVKEQDEETARPDDNETPADDSGDGPDDRDAAEADDAADQRGDGGGSALHRTPLLSRDEQARLRKKLQAKYH